MKNQNNTKKNSKSLNAEKIDSNLNEDLNAFELNVENQVPVTDKISKSNSKVISVPDEIKMPAHDTDKNLDLLIRNAGEIDERTKDLLIANRNLIQKLFPTKMDKMVLEMQQNTIQSAMEFRLNLYKMSTQFRLEALREKYNAALMTIRGEYRVQVSKFMMAKLRELHIAVDKEERLFIEFAKSKYDHAKLQIGYPSIQSLYITNINEQSLGYMNFLQRQIANFESIIDEQIERFH